MDISVEIILFIEKNLKKYNANEIPSYQTFCKTHKIYKNKKSDGKKLKMQ